MKVRLIWATAIALILLSLPALVLAQPPITPSAEIPGDGVGTAPLGSPGALWDQPIGAPVIVIAQYFPDWGGGVYSADDFSNAAPWNIESIFIDGGTWPSATGSLPQADSLNWVIYPDAGGVPGGDPGAGGELWSHSCLPTAPEVTISGANSGDVTLDIVQAQGGPLYLPPGHYWLCFYPSLNLTLYGQWGWFLAGTTNLATAHFIDPTNTLTSGWTSWTPSTVWDPIIHDLAFRLEGGVVAPPPNAKYLHSHGLFNLTHPVDTQWHELWPFFCKEYHLGSWEDNGDGVLSHCDWIDMYEKPDGEVKWYHVEEVTITLNVTPARDAKRFGSNGLPPPMFIELEGGYDPSVLIYPLGSQWHEIYPVFCGEYELVNMQDGGKPIGQLSFCDDIMLQNKHTGEPTWWHVEQVAVDIIVTPEPPPVGGEAYPVGRASLLAPWIAVGLVLAGGASWYFLRRRKAQS
jgi:hypothetical protein